MTQTQEFKSIQENTQKLLDKTEGFDVDFKQSLSNVNADDFVAFANSAGGGTLLFGVKEITDAQGKQRGHVIGCDVSDKAKLSILDKALSCVPPIDVIVTIENTDHIPILRVDIPAGKHKPYCTSSGRYTIREDGRKRPLVPNELWEIFLRTKKKQFANNLQEAVEPLFNDYVSEIFWEKAGR